MQQPKSELLDFFSYYPASKQLTTAPPPPAKNKATSSVLFLDFSIKKAALWLTIPPPDSLALALGPNCPETTSRCCWRTAPAAPAAASIVLTFSKTKQQNRRRRRSAGNIIRSETIWGPEEGHFHRRRFSSPKIQKRASVDAAAAAAVDVKLTEEHHHHHTFLHYENRKIIEFRTQFRSAYGKLL